MDDYCIKSGYVHREEPEYYHDGSGPGTVAQPLVYRTLARMAAAVDAPTIIDVGCGNGFKLRRFMADRHVIGIDYGANLEVCRRTLPRASWREADLEVRHRLPISDQEADGALVVCADVIEHLRRPEHLIHGLVDLRERGARCVLLSTPERDLERGIGHVGPSPNTAHVREWNRFELGELLRREGLVWQWLGLSRTNTDRRNWHTTLAVAADPLLWDTLRVCIPHEPRHATDFRTRHAYWLDPFLARGYALRPLADRLRAPIRAIRNSRG